jgi:hypothetical protein
MGRVNRRNLAAVYITQSFPYHLLGHASTFSALAGYAEDHTDITVTAATFVDCSADLAVGDSLAQAYVHTRILGSGGLIRQNNNLNANDCQSLDMFWFEIF